MRFLCLRACEILSVLPCTNRRRRPARPCLGGAPTGTSAGASTPGGGPLQWPRGARAAARSPGGALGQRYSMGSSVVPRAAASALRLAAQTQRAGATPQALAVHDRWGSPRRSDRAGVLWETRTAPSAAQRRIHATPRYGGEGPAGAGGAATVPTAGWLRWQSQPPPHLPQSAATESPIVLIGGKPDNGGGAALWVSALHKDGFSRALQRRAGRPPPSR